MWFTPTKPGRYHLFCAEYCGTEHSGMVGWVTVMTENDYENGWPAVWARKELWPSKAKGLFGQLGCATRSPIGPAGPRSDFARSLWLARSVAEWPNRPGGRRLYSRIDSESQCQGSWPATKRTLCRPFQGQITEEQLLQLIVYVKSLAIQGAPPISERSGGAATPNQTPTTGEKK